MWRSHPNLNHLQLYKLGEAPLKPSDSSECFPSEGTLFLPHSHCLFPLTIKYPSLFNNEGADDIIPQFTPEKGIIPLNQSIQQMETTMRELLERQTREAKITTEAMKWAEAMAAK
ncbi:hypothetical protein PIB30_067040 [Stylosanthes scabra]|uniref:Uncharacterized protein n=1 Tax=Stylosanthes scabra TaxID=79078 RepID=A0ABU6SPE0_9FABA|nr:hypothetical protein [Stylosanthes scabra]